MARAPRCCGWRVEVKVEGHEDERGTDKRGEKGENRNERGEGGILEQQAEGGVEEVVDDEEEREEDEGWST